jgi:hypothetical protein
MDNGRSRLGRSRFSWLNPTLLVALALSTAGCSVVGAIFKAGVWTAVVGIVILLALAYGAVRLFRRAA